MSFRRAVGSNSPATIAKRWDGVHWTAVAMPTPMTERMKKGVPQPNGSIEVEPTMNVDNVAKAVVYMASLPLDANVLFLTVMATKMPFVGRG